MFHERATVSPVKRAAIYSSTSRMRRSGARQDAGAAAGGVPGTVAAPAARSERPRAVSRRGAAALAVGGGFLVLLLVLAWLMLRPAPREFTQDDIDAAVLHTLENKTLPSKAAKAADAVRASVVLVRGYVADGKGGEREHGVGSGVVIVDKGIILTNLHVVAVAKRMTVTFF